MMIPLGRRRLSISLLPPDRPELSLHLPGAAETDAELARLARSGRALSHQAEQAERRISRILYAGPVLR